jgi:hypothetical protein
VSILVFVLARFGVGSKSIAPFSSSVGKDRLSDGRGGVSTGGGSFTFFSGGCGSGDGKMNGGASIEWFGLKTLN